ncbi:MAG: pantetheine-phosphate adenylyltransferase [Nitrospirae bacterium]|nr:pantetheine-phosphate adenylyltransferase [Nitrospirota bacterium]
MKRIAIYPGTFDPVTYGHIDLIKRGASLFDRFIIAVAHSYDKKPLFSVEERVEMLKTVTGTMSGVEVDDFGGLLVNYVKGQGARVIVRGLRVISDFEFEFQMALTNRNLVPDIETVFMMTNESYSYFSSRIIKETVKLGAEVDKFVPPQVMEKLKEKLR